MVNDARVLQHVLNAVLCSTGPSLRAFFGKRREENFFVLNFYKKFGVIYNRNGERGSVMTDRELIRKLHTGDRSALDGIVEKYYDDIYRFCLYMTMDETDSYDIVQEVFLRFIKYADSYTHENLKGYLLIIARNLCRDYFRKREREKTADLEADAVSERDGIEDIEQKLLLDTILQKLPIEQRETVILRFREEMGFQDIARILGCSLSTAKSRCRLGVRRMRKEMEAYERK